MCNYEDAEPQKPTSATSVATQLTEKHPKAKHEIPTTVQTPNYMIVIHLFLAKTFTQGTLLQKLRVTVPQLQLHYIRLNMGYTCVASLHQRGFFFSTLSF